MQEIAPIRLPGCPLCEEPGGTLVWRGPLYRIVRADEEGFPAFYRVVWQDHVAEFSDLPAPDRLQCMEAVAQVEALLREQLRPDKINLAALGNQVAHLHWHVIARFEDDSHFPRPIWGAPIRGRDLAHESALARRLPAVDMAIAQHFSAAAAADARSGGA